MSILTEILEWVEDKPVFWQEAIKRLLLKNNLDEQDILDLIQLVKNQEYYKTDVEPIDVDVLKSLVQVLDGEKDTTINKIYDTQNINALKDGVELTFENEGISVIYGDNGSGKSSFVSVLKHVCNTRGGYPKITNNLFKEGTESICQFAKVEYQIDEISKVVSWEDGIIDSNVLKAVDVFDSSSANHYIEGEDLIAFIPSDLSILDKLASACGKVEAVIQEEISKLGDRRFNHNFLRTESLSDTQSFLTDLSDATNIDSIRSHNKLTVQENEKYKKLEEKIIKLKATDPNKLKQLNERKINRFKRVSQKLSEMQLSHQREKKEKTITLLKNYNKAKSILNSVQEELFSDSKIDNIGSDTWKELWKSAKKFYEKVEGNTFPDNSKDAICPLCLQPLDDEASKRFITFDKFIKEDAEKNYNLSKNIIEANKQEYLSVNSNFEDINETIIELSELTPSFKLAYDSFVENHKNYIKGLTDNLFDIDFLSQLILIEPELCPIKLIQTEILNLENKNKELGKNSIEQELRDANNNLNELKAKSKIAEFKPQLVKEVLRLRKITALRSCIQKCHTRSITLLSSRLTRDYVNDRLKSAFEDELIGLGFRNVQISFDTRGQKGKQYNYLSLDPSYGSATRLKEILSEGEHRCISLATFLSELSISDHKSAIVFDDPVSSLDHKWRNRIAKRIVRESLERQVIIFTHDITFLLLLQEHAKILETKIAVKSVTRKRRETGITRENPPWDALSVKKRIKDLNVTYQLLEKIYRTETEEKYEVEVKVFYGKLRETWERFVEEDILNNTIKRFGREIQTQRLKKVIDLTIDDYKAIEQNMSKCSTYFTGHDTAGALIEETLLPDEIKKDIEFLVNYRKELLNRRK